MKIFIETERLIFREIIASDGHGMFELYNDPEVHKYLGEEPVQNIKQTEAIIEFIRQQYHNNGIGRWAVVDKQNNNFIGWSGLKLVQETTNNQTDYHDLGYRFIRKYWGLGYATEAALAALAYGFEKLGLKEIYAMTDIANNSSEKVLEKVGMRFIEKFDLKGIEHNWFKITKTEWREI